MEPGTMSFNGKRGPRGSRRGEPWRRRRSAALALMLCPVIPTASVAAQGTTTSLAEFVPPLSFGLGPLDDTRVRDLVASPDDAERRGFSTDDAERRGFST